jgi:hypothetical protein
MLEIHVLAWDRHKHVAELNRLCPKCPNLKNIYKQTEPKHDGNIIPLVDSDDDDVDCILSSQSDFSPCQDKNEIVCNICML